MTAIKRKLQDLADLLESYDKAYYLSGTPLVDDATYDKLRESYLALESQNPASAPLNSPSKRVGIYAQTAKINYIKPMLSLQKSYHDDDIRDFLQRLQALLPEENLFPFMAEPKIDGVSLNVRYDRGIFQGASTRGDGHKGDNVSKHVMGVVPKTLGEKISVDVRGELYIPLARFEPYNLEREQKGLPPTPNARNATAGILHHLELSWEREFLAFVAYGLGDWDIEVKTLSSLRKYLHLWGFSTAEPSLLCHTLADMKTYFQHVDRKRRQLPFDADGVVFKENDRTLYHRLGNSTTFPRGAVALKFSAQTGITKIRALNWQVGRMGNVTPISILQPINVGGVRISRASLHNPAILHKLNVHIGDLVKIQRSGDVIPQVIKVLESASSAEEPITPTVCPSCHTDLERRGPTYFCPNRAGCKAQRVACIAYVAGRNVLNIDGFGEKAAQQLFDAELLHEASDLFDLKSHKQKLLQLPGWSEKSVQNLLEGIRGATRTTLDRAIMALNLPGISEEYSRKFAEYFKTFSNFRLTLNRAACEEEDTREQFLHMDGMGLKRLEAILAPSKDPTFQKEMQKLENCLYILPYREEFGPLGGETIVFTGSLSQSRRLAKELAKRLGARVTGSYNRSVTLVVAGDKPGSTWKKARDAGTRILSPQQWQQLLSEHLSEFQ